MAQTNITFTAGGTADTVLKIKSKNSFSSLDRLGIIYDDGGNLGGGTIKMEVSQSYDFTYKATVNGSISSSTNKSFNCECNAEEYVRFSLSGSTSPDFTVSVVGDFQVVTE